MLNRLVRDFLGVSVELPKSRRQELVELASVQPDPAAVSANVDFDAMLQLGDKQFLTTRADQGLTTQRAPRTFGRYWGWFSHQCFVFIFSDSF